MARLLSQHLYRRQCSAATLFFPGIISPHRYMSGKAHSIQFIELNGEPSSSPSSSSSEGDDTIGTAMRRLDEAMQTFIIRRAAPDWLPFRPGASYWVPPPDRNHPCSGLIEILGRLPNSRRVTSGAHARAASSGFFSEDESSNWGDARAYPVPVIVEVKMLENTDVDTSDDDDEEV